MNKVHPKEILHSLPTQPGVYRYFDEQNNLIYIGKAKNLKNRISSYFVNKHQDNKTRRLVQLIKHVEFTIVHSEFDALLLENTLIKQFQPRYNILLRDDKTYPFICITNERFPRIITTRKIDHSLGQFYGPFANPKSMHTLIEMVRQLYPIRTCTLALKQENIEANKFKVCLEFHIGNCKGPCENLQDEIEYNEHIQQINHILKGNFQIAKNYFYEQMMLASKNLAFERAQDIKEKWELLDNFQAKSTVVNPSIQDADVFTIVSDESTSYFNFMHIINGTITQAQTWDVKRKLEEDESELLEMMVLEKREQFQSQAKEIITNIPLGIEFKGVKQTVPQMGDKKSYLICRSKMYYISKKTKPTEKQRKKVVETERKEFYLHLKMIFS